MQHATLKSSCFLFALDIQVWKPKDTPSKFNSSPLNTYEYLPTRKFHLPTIHFQWQAVNLPGVIKHFNATYGLIRSHSKIHKGPIINQPVLRECNSSDVFSRLKRGFDG